MSAAGTSSVEGYPDIVPYPDDLAARYRAEAWGGKGIAAEFGAMASAQGERPALVTPSGVTSYAELDRRSDRVAAGLWELGRRPGERVLLQLTNTGTAVVAWYGLIKAGLVPIATLAQHRRHEMVEIARQSEPTVHLVQADFPSFDLAGLARETAATQPTLKALLTIGAEGEGEPGTVGIESLMESLSDEEARQRVESIQAGIDPEGLGVLQLSGGTTNVPKLIPRSHVDYWYNSLAYARVVGLGEGKCVAHLLPMIHNAGIVCALHAAHSVGGSFATCNPDPEQLRAMTTTSVPVTHLLLVRPILRMLEADSSLLEGLGSVEGIMWADRKLPPAARQMFETNGCRIQQMFGMGEGMCMVTPRDASVELRHETNGVPLSPLDEIRLYVPGTEDEVAAGEAGELCCRGPYTIRGYYRSPERNAEAFTGDGFYRTGDIMCEVAVGGEPSYSLEDRVKDLISRGGEKVNALEVEELLVRHPAIAEAALVAMPDERLGERACAYVVVAAGSEPPTVSDVAAYLDELGVAKFKWPERIQPREKLPLTNVQKVNKAFLRREIAELIAAERT